MDKARLRLDEIARLNGICIDGSIGCLAHRFDDLPCARRENETACPAIKNCWTYSLKGCPRSVLFLTEGPAPLKTLHFSIQIIKSVDFSYCTNIFWRSEIRVIIRYSLFSGNHARSHPWGARLIKRTPLREIMRLLGRHCEAPIKRRGCPPPVHCQVSLSMSISDSIWKCEMPPSKTPSAAARSRRRVASGPIPSDACSLWRRNRTCDFAFPFDPKGPTRLEARPPDGKSAY